MQRDLFFTKRVIVFLIIVLGCVSSASFAEQWKIPLGGNAFPVDAGQSRQLSRDGVLSLRSDRDRFSVFFRVDRAGSLQLGDSITTRCHNPTTLDGLTQQLVLLLDGEHTRESLVHSLVRYVEDSDMELQSGGRRLTEPAAIRQLISHNLDANLAVLARKGVLVS
ncbi:MAG: hypothetical protein AAFX06_15175 [Planctomycetota bacterium]